MADGTGQVLRALGLMSGTSMDGVDCALIETDGRDVVRFGPTGFLPYTAEDRALLREALRDAVPLEDRTARPGVLSAAERLVTLRHAEAVEAFLAANALDRAGIAVVGFHGQTVLHRPERFLTVQIGRGADLAARLGLDVVSDFRAADVAAGGQGAPLVPVYHQALVRAMSPAEPILVINIGGVANVTFVPAAGAPIACDTGPGNALIDDLMLARTGRAFDADGATAAGGTVDAVALATLLDHPFFVAPAPKSLDRNAFSAAPVAKLSLADAAATLVAFTAQSIAAILDHLPSAPNRAIVCGGGARNRALMAELGRRLPHPVTTADQQGWIGDGIEAQAFAYLAVRSLEGLPLTFPTTTGVAQALPGGVLARARSQALAS